MNKTITFQDLILLAYNETGCDDSKEILYAINQSEELRADYRSILDVQHVLDGFQEEPSESIINNILNYSKALNVFNLKPAVTSAIFIVN